MVAALLALAASLCWGTGDLLAGLAGRRASSWSVSLVSQAVGLCAGLLLLLALGRPWPGFWAMMPSLLAGFALAVGMVVYFTALAVGTMSVVAPIASACAVVPVAVGLARGEQPGVAQVVGVVAVVVGVGLAVYERENAPHLVGTIEVGAGVPPQSRPASDRPRNRLGAILAVTAALCFGATLVGFAMTAEYDPFWPAVGGRLTSVASLLLLAPVLRVRMDGLLAAGGGSQPESEPRRGPRLARSAARSKREVYWLPPGARLMTAAAGLSHLGAATLFSVASTRGLLSLVSVLSSLAAIVTVGLAFLVLGERLGRQQLAGVALALAGVLAIAGG